jgi:hypothetical protein
MASLPWSAVLDEEGQTYYYNVETGESAWELPSSNSIAAAPPLQPHPAPESSSSSLKSDGWFYSDEHAVDGVQGPFTLDDLVGWLSAGHFQPEDVVFHGRCGVPVSIAAATSSGGAAAAAIVDDSDALAAAADDAVAVAVTESVVVTETEDPSELLPTETKAKKKKKKKKTRPKSTRRRASASGRRVSASWVRTTSGGDDDYDAAEPPLTQPLTAAAAAAAAAPPAPAPAARSTRLPRAQSCRLPLSTTARVRRASGLERGRSLGALEEARGASYTTDRLRAEWLMERDLQRLVPLLDAARPALRFDALASLARRIRAPGGPAAVEARFTAAGLRTYQLRKLCGALSEVPLLADPRFLATGSPRWGELEIPTTKVSVYLLIYLIRYIV